MPSKSISITEAESVVMGVLWNRSPMPTEEIVAAPEGEQHWQAATIKTLLNRLLNKKAIRAVNYGRRSLYPPVIVRDEWAAGSRSSWRSSPACRSPWCVGRAWPERSNVASL